MRLPKINNLTITEITNEVFIAHQIKPPYYFSCCDGLIVSPGGRSSNTIILDLNIEPNLVNEIVKLFSPISHYVCTHGHMDHIAHVHQWERLGAQIHAPIPEHEYLLDLEKFYKGFGWDKALEFSYVQKFAKLNKYQPCKKVDSFLPGKTLKFGEIEIETIPLSGHSKAHIGFYLPKHKILHISCLGFDLLTSSSDGFGPWYGFEECSIDQYMKDIELTERIFTEKAEFLSSSHSYVVRDSDLTPFEYMRKKIVNNQRVVDEAILALKQKDLPIDMINLLNLDVFFPKKKMNDFRKEIWGFWEAGIIKKHLEKSKYY